jgi:AraC family transcriptional regulator, transcriptional activator of pobA
MLNTAIPYFDTLAAFYKAINVAEPIHEHFDVRLISQNLKTVKMQMPPFRNACFMISLTIKGQGSVHYAGTHAYRVGDLSVFFTAPGQLQSWEVLPDWEGVYVIFTPSFFATNKVILDEIKASPFFDIDNSVSLTLLPQEANELLALFDKVKYEAKADLHNKYEFIKSYLHLMMMHLNRFFEKRIQNNQKPNPQASGINTVKAFQQAIEDNFNAQQRLKTVAEFAEVLHVHPNYLNALCKEVVGKTASEILHDNTILQAKSLILHSNLSMKEIAYHLGYDEPNYFYRFFKKHTGSTPSDFKSNQSL